MAQLKTVDSTGSFKLRVAALPSSSLAYTNAVYISNKNMHLLPQGDGATYFEINKKAVYLVRTHEALQGNEIAMGTYQRDSFGFNQGFEVDCEIYNPVGKPDLTISVLNVKMELISPLKACTISEDDLTKAFMERYSKHVFALDQSIAVEYAGKTLKVTTVAMQVFAQNEESKGKTLSDVTKQGSRGLLTDIAFIAVVPVKHKVLTWQPTSKRAKQLLRPDWDFSKMGIGGVDKEFAQIFRRAFTSRLYPASVIKQFGQQHVKGMLLYGPPGTGKTLIARQIGKLLEGREPKVVNGPEILNKFVGASEENIRKLFEDAEIDQKEHGDDSDLHIIIFDEIDAICKSRGSMRDSTGVHDTIVNQLLSKIDGVHSLNNILVIGMTNRKDLIDDALLRPGRLEVHVEIGLPDKHGRLQILKIHTEQMRLNGRLDPNIDFDELAELTKNFSGAEIAGLVRDAISHALYAHVDTKNLGSGSVKTDHTEDIIITMDEFRHALSEVKPAFGVEEDNLKALIRVPMVPYSDEFQQLLSSCRTMVNQVRTSANTPLMSVLLEGSVGSGKTAIAASLGLESDFPFVKLVSPENFVGYGDSSRVNQINKIFEDAYKSPLSIVILDSIERLLDYVPIGPVFSNQMLQALMVLLKKVPPKDGRRLLIIGTTTNADFLRRTEMLHQFNFVLHVPTVETPEHVRRVFEGIKAPITAKALEEISKVCPRPIGIKQLLLLIEMARQEESTITVNAFNRAVQSSGFALKGQRFHAGGDTDLN